MPEIGVTSLEIRGYSLTATPGTTAGTSSNMPDSTDHLIILDGRGRGNGAGISHAAELLVGASGSRTVYAVHEHSSVTFAVSGSLDTDANGCQSSMGAAFTYTSGTSHAMEIQADSGDGSGTGQWSAYAFDISNISGAFHQEDTNSDTATDTPTSGWEDVGTQLSETTAAGDYWLVVSTEAFDDGATAGTDEIGIRVDLDGTVINGSTLEKNITANEVYGYLYQRVVTLTAATHTVDVQVNGTISNGNVSVRRTRIHLIPVDELEDSDGVEDTDAGETVTGTTTQTVGDISITLNPPASRDYYLWAANQKQVSFWSQGNIQLGGVDAITNGFGVGVADLGTGATDDLVMEMAGHVETGVSSSTAATVLLDKVGGGGSNQHGSNATRAGGSDELVLVAIRLYTPDPDITLTPAGGRLRFQATAPTQTVSAVTDAHTSGRLRFQATAPTQTVGAVTEAPTAGQLRFQETAPTQVVSAVSDAPAAGQLRFQATAPTQTVGAVTEAHTSGRLRFNDSATTITLGNSPQTVVATAGRLRFQETAPTQVVSAVTDAPAAGRLRFNEGAETLSRSLASVAGRLRFNDATHTTSTAVATATPTAGQLRFNSATATTNLGPLLVAAGRLRFNDATTTIRNTVPSTGGRLRFADAATITAVGVVTTSAASGRLRFVAGGTTATGGIPVSAPGLPSPVLGFGVVAGTSSTRPARLKSSRTE